ncbi:glycosyltransferase [Sphingomonas changnyeongensis]|uniref:Glycosyltransferase n=1 Tax=Sphingomonas changnyeongensis TaxID=2698679 RepID=A0A7Z2S7C6_9SPHN|nr:glycosyltransferase family 2 protein [Sphingomonas changnyeongensis]QHL90226.1 glycosyltransferase [Sphingomonas changnyeongensis]
MPLLSIVIPTRDRAPYLAASIATALQSTDAPLEVLVLDNASADNTRDIVAAIADPRLRYERSERRLSMRDNFERGLRLAQGEYIGFIGDDDGILGHAPAAVHAIFDNPKVDAIAAARAHYYWPDLEGGRRGSALLPRGEGMELRNSRQELRKLLDDSDYYRLPCIYHGFVRRSLIDRNSKDRFFLSSQVDIYSAIALSMAGVTFAFSHAPLVINGGSARSNGASHFGGGTAEERNKWKQEDDLGFLPGFDNHATVGVLIVESALRYAAAFDVQLEDIFPRNAIDQAMHREHAARIALGRPLDNFDQAAAAAGSTGRMPQTGGALDRVRRLARSFSATMPIDAAARGVTDVKGAADLIQGLLARGRQRNFDRPGEQLRIALRIGRG